MQWVWLVTWLRWVYIPPTVVAGEAASGARTWGVRIHHVSSSIQVVAKYQHLKHHSGLTASRYCPAILLPWSTWAEIQQSSTVSYKYITHARYHDYLLSMCKGQKEGTWWRKSYHQTHGTGSAQCPVNNCCLLPTCQSHTETNSLLVTYMYKKAEANIRWYVQ
jgi:hypothetical protein